MLNRLRLQLSLSLFIGSLALALLAGLSPLAWLIGSFHSVTNPQTLILAAIIGLILVMSRLMEDSGHMKRLVESFALLSREFSQRIRSNKFALYETGKADQGHGITDRHTNSQEEKEECKAYDTNDNRTHLNISPMDLNTSFKRIKASMKMPKATAMTKG